MPFRYSSNTRGHNKAVHYFSRCSADSTDMPGFFFSICNPGSISPTFQVCCWHHALALLSNPVLTALALLARCNAGSIGPYSSALLAALPFFSWQYRLAFFFHGSTDLPFFSWQYRLAFLFHGSTDLPFFFMAVQPCPFFSWQYRLAFFFHGSTDFH